jgi:hypothetical protein
MTTGEIVLSSLTGLLAAVTAWMAIATQKMASATREMLKRDAEPQLYLCAVNARTVYKGGGLGSELRVVGVQPSFTLRNPGRVRVSYEIERMEITLKGREWPREVGFELSNVLHADQEMSIFHSPIPSDAPMGPGETGICSLIVAFWKAPKERHKFTLKVRFSMEKVSDNEKVASLCRWLFVEPPTYE